jgi:copper chaperone CopZ
MKSNVILKVGVVAFLSFAMYSCTSSDSEGIEEVIVENVVANKVAVFEVEGMTCKMGCGGTIRKSLLSTKVVEQVEIDFEDDRASNIVTVHYNGDITNASELLAVINQINDNQFSASLHAED